MTDAISRYLTDDHHRCDHLLVACEAAVNAGAWSTLDDTVAVFRESVLRHFALEEEILFPELEQANPAAGGPIGVMRMEHQQMRQLLTDLADATRSRDRDTCLGDLETLLMLVQQHNAKEEGILYPLADGAFPLGADEFVARMKAA
ncbi:MAG: hemerythrin domain-containing protein [Pseudomonadota bacterium]|nr:hemerythrin domain-containing protein [Pseudomonadota bacterium]